MFGVKPFGVGSFAISESSSSHLIYIASSSQLNAASSAAIKQTHLITCDDVVQSIIVSPVYTGDTSLQLIVAANVVQTSAATPVVVSQTHLTTVANSTQANAVTGVSVGHSVMTLTTADIQAIVDALALRILPVNIAMINGVLVNGAGVPGNEWGPT